MLTERQQQIIEESIKIIDDKGIQGLTIKNLSKAIGISEPGIYRHFESKTEILLSILNNFKEMAIMLAGIMETYEDSALFCAMHDPLFRFSFLGVEIGSVLALRASSVPV